ncbi:MAG: hypothetical protein DMG42_01170 [Acidobacteria bacterium]|nr:MAG: hypothetical protein DMG42_01170 [Acidobacteriota bacterium]
MGAASLVLDQSMPELAGQRGFYDQIVSDLRQRGLMANVEIHTMMTANGMFSSRTTPLGREFLRFICQK